jgi:hypothetical protein
VVLVLRKAFLQRRLGGALPIRPDDAYGAADCGRALVPATCSANPLDHRGVYPPLCSVLFSVHEVFGGASQDTLSVDVHEDWLSPADTYVPASDGC